MPTSPAKAYSNNETPRAFRAGEKPLDSSRRYMAVYARANLERNWKKQ
jgi:hypothetical protein